jgi:hypothetical protein
MTWPKINHIVNSAERHKIIILQCSPALSGSCIQEIQNAGYPVLDVGFDIAKFISTLSSRRYLTLDVHDYYQKLIRDYAFTAGSNPDPVVVLHNIGILHEPELMLNVSHLLKETAKTCQVLFVWQGVVRDNGMLSWSSDETNYSIDLTHIPLKIQNYEI